eukprot:RCo010852
MFSSSTAPQPCRPGPACSFAPMTPSFFSCFFFGWHGDLGSRVQWEMQSWTPASVAGSAFSAASEDSSCASGFHIPRRRPTCATIIITTTSPPPPQKFCPLCP